MDPNPLIPLNDEIFTIENLIDPAGQVRNIYKETELRQALLEAAQKSFNDENLEFLILMKNLNDRVAANTIDQDELETELSIIYNTYIITGSPRQLNLANQDRNAILENIEKDGYLMSSFANAITVAKRLVKTNEVPPFLQSPTFKNYVVASALTPLEYVKQVAKNYDELSNGEKVRLFSLSGVKPIQFKQMGTNAKKMAKVGALKELGLHNLLSPDPNLMHQARMNIKRMFDRAGDDLSDPKWDEFWEKQGKKGMTADQIKENIQLMRKAYRFALISKILEYCMTKYPDEKDLRRELNISVADLKAIVKEMQKMNGVHEEEYAEQAKFEAFLAEKLAAIKSEYGDEVPGKKGMVKMYETQLKKVQRYSGETIKKFMSQIGIADHNFREEARKYMDDARRAENVTQKGGKAAKVLGLDKPSRAQDPGLQKRMENVSTKLNDSALQMPPPKPEKTVSQGMGSSTTKPDLPNVSAPAKPSAIAPGKPAQTEAAKTAPIAPAKPIQTAPAHGIEIPAPAHPAYGYMREGMAHKKDMIIGAKSMIFTTPSALLEFLDKASFADKQGFTIHLNGNTREDCEARLKELKDLHKKMQGEKSIDFDFEDLKIALVAKKENVIQSVETKEPQPPSPTNQSKKHIR